MYTIIPNKHSHNTASIIDFKQIYWMNINKRVKFKYDLIYKNYFPYQLRNVRWTTPTQFSYPRYSIVNILQFRAL